MDILRQGKPGNEARVGWTSSVRGSLGMRLGWGGSTYPALTVKSVLTRWVLCITLQRLLVHEHFCTFPLSRVSVAMSAKFEEHFWVSVFRGCWSFFVAFVSQAAREL